MKPWQTVVRYGAIALALVLIVNIAVWGLSVLGSLLGLVSSGTYDEAKDYKFETDIDSLDVDISAATFVIRHENCEAVTVKSNLKNLTVKERSGKLKIDMGNFRVSSNEAEPFVEVLLPVGTELRELDLDLGAGKTLVSSVTVGKADIDGGAGELLINHCIITELDLDMGVGKLDFRGKITDKADISLGVGESEFIFLGDRDDYRISVDRGIGSISVEGEDFKGGTVGNGDIRVDIDGGIGKIAVRFFDKANNQ